MLAFRCYPLQSFSNAEQLSAKLRPQPPVRASAASFSFLDRGWASCVAGPCTSVATGPDTLPGPSEYLRKHEESSIWPEQQLDWEGGSASLQTNNNSQEHPLCVACSVCLVHARSQSGIGGTVIQTDGGSI